MNNIACDQKFAIVIVTYNRKELLKECLFCAMNQENTNVELFVIDNASDDGTQEYLDYMTSCYPFIHVKRTVSNLGGAGGFYEGLKYAYDNSNCSAFVLIDDDAMLCSDYIEKICSFFKEKYLAYSGSVIVDGAVDTSHRLRNKGRVPIEEYEKATFECDIATFCGLVVTRKLIDEIGFPMSEFFIWHDDTEYSMRISEYSRILNVSAAKLNHRTKIVNVFLNSKHKDNWKEYYGMRNMIYICKKYKKRKELSKRLIRCVGKAIVFYLKSLFDKEYREILRYNAILRIDAVTDGFRGKLGKNKKYLPR